MPGERLCGPHVAACQRPAGASKGRSTPSAPPRLNPTAWRSPILWRVRRGPLSRLEPGRGRGGRQRVPQTALAGRTAARQCDGPPRACESLSPRHAPGELARASRTDSSASAAGPGWPVIPLETSPSAVTPRRDPASPCGRNGTRGPIQRGSPLTPTVVRGSTWSRMVFGASGTTPSALNLYR